MFVSYSCFINKNLFKKVVFILIWFLIGISTLRCCWCGCWDLRNATCEEYNHQSRSQVWILFYVISFGFMFLFELVFIESCFVLVSKETLLYISCGVSFWVWLWFDDFRVTKQNRAAGILENFEEGEKYSQHGLRKYVRGRTPQIMPTVNNFFSDPSN